MKKLLFILAAVFLFSQVFAQEEEVTPEVTSEVSEETTEAASTGKKIPIDFVLQFEPGVYINTESTLVSAPSPIVYPVTFGILWPNESRFSVQPTLSFFLMYHLMYNNRALPAEIENRTTTTLSFMLNIPVMYSVYLKKSRFQFNAGVAMLIRFGFLSLGVKDSDSGWTGSAGGDVSAINSWFWNDMRWFYLTIGTSWLYNLTPQLKAGPVINCYIPVGGLISDHDVQGMMISLGIKICR